MVNPITSPQSPRTTVDCNKMIRFLFLISFSPRWLFIQIKIVMQVLRSDMIPFYTFFFWFSCSLWG